jgi:hypothetical protein
MSLPGLPGAEYHRQVLLDHAVDVQGFGFDYRDVGTPRMFGADAHYHF